MTTSTNSPSPVRPTRRHFSVEQKLRILAAYEAAKTPEARGAVLRREGIYSSHIALWRQKRDGGGKTALDRKRGPKPNPQARELERLRRQNERLLKRTAQLEKIVEVQGKMQALLQELGSKETAPSSEPSRKKR
ncbi:MAG: transposase [Candidatus Cybelea sp.]